MSEAQELEAVRARTFSVSLGTTSKEAKLMQAADIHLKLGQIERYCEIMVELGEWDKALAIAPGVSMDYWHSLTERRAMMLISEDNIEAVPYCIASSSLNQLINFYSERCQLEDALLVAQAASEGLFKSTITEDSLKVNNVSLKRSNVLPTVNKFQAEGPRLLGQTSQALADWYFKDAQPVLAACCHLAVADIKNAISKLIRGNELELAVSLARLFPKAEDLLAVATELLARRCENLDRWDDAITLLKTLPNPQPYLERLCIRYPGTTAKINVMHSKANIPTIEECLSTAEKLSEENKHLEAMKFYLLSSAPELALDIGINLVRDLLGKELWSLDELLSVTEPLSFIRTEKLQHGKRARQRDELLVIAAYCGALLAIRRKYSAVVMPLFENVRHLMTKSKIDLPVKLQQIQAESEAWLIHLLKQRPNVPQTIPLPTDEQQKIWKTLETRIGSEKNEYIVGEYMVAGSHFPSHSESHTSYFSRKKINGPVFFLEDGFSALSYNDALMWARVNAFCPLASGSRINPF